MRQLNKFELKEVTRALAREIRARGRLIDCRIVPVAGERGTDRPMIRVTHTGAVWSKGLYPEEVHAACVAGTLSELVDDFLEGKEFLP